MAPIPMRLHVFLRPALVALAAGMLVAGCMTPAINDPARVGPFFVPRNVVGEPTLGGIHRVVLLPVWTGTAAPEDTAVDLDPVFVQALQAQNRFEVVTAPRERLARRFGFAAVSSAAALPRDLLPMLEREYGADAVLFVDVTVYRPYPPLAIGIRTRLARLGNLHLVWAADNVFSADDPTVAAAARAHFLDSKRQQVPGDLTPAVLQSPGRFAAYAADATFDTLPPVTTARLAESPVRRR